MVIFWGGKDSHRKNEGDFQGPSNILFLRLAGGNMDV